MLLLFMRLHWELPGLSSGCAEGFLSFVRVYGLLVLGSCMMEEPCFSKLTIDRENGFMGAAGDIGTDTGASDRPVAGASLCRQRREVSCYEICGNGAGGLGRQQAAVGLYLEAVY